MKKEKKMKISIAYIERLQQRTSPSLDCGLVELTALAAFLNVKEVFYYHKVLG
jgi:hypothetical protein